MEVNMGNTDNGKERKKIIKELHKLADEVFNLKKNHRQKRPIVIEFSGSPKSGKTSCINSLELFLKRNGFCVEIVHERASVCPVNDKHSPMFNLWTSCMSISAMLGVLERKEINCDVLILDRGIFDAFCWFNWLLSKKFMEEEQKKVIEDFLMMDALRNRIDIVFVFCAEPTISIEREYATLLTDKLGTIMNNEVLSEYLSSIQIAIEEKKPYFHSISKIDTSRKTQDEVGKEVTEITLTTLKNLLMERIGFFKLSKDEWSQISQKRIYEYSELSNVLPHIKFDLREKVEDSDDSLQPIPIVVITNQEHSKVLTIKKSPKAVSNDSPEKDKLLLYVGGHTRFEDFTDINSDDFLTICKYTLRREVKEEIGISLAFNNTEPFFIYTPDSAKSKRHIGICFVVELNIDTLKLRLDPQELLLNKGASKSGRFQDVGALDKLNDELESWSIEILKKCFDICIDKSNEQITLFDSLIDT